MYACARMRVRVPVHAFMRVHACASPCVRVCVQLCVGGRMGSGRASRFFWCRGHGWGVAKNIAQTEFLLESWDFLSVERVSWGISLAQAWRSVARRCLHSMRGPPHAMPSRSNFVFFDISVVGHDKCGFVYCVFCSIAFDSIMRSEMHHCKMGSLQPSDKNMRSSWTHQGDWSARSFLQSFNVNPVAWLVVCAWCTALPPACLESMRVSGTSMNRRERLKCCNIFPLVLQ